MAHGRRAHVWPVCMFACMCGMGLGGLAMCATWAMCNMMALMQRKKGLRLKLASSGPPKGAIAFAHVITLLGENHPNFNNICNVHKVSPTPRALACDGSA